MSRRFSAYWKVYQKQLARKEFDLPIVFQGACLGGLRERHGCVVEFMYQAPFPFYTFRTLIFKRTADATRFAKWVESASIHCNEQHREYLAKNRQ